MSLTPCPCACVTETGLDWQEKLIRTIMRYIGILHDVKIPSNETSAAIASATKATQSKTTLTQLSKLQLSISQVLPLPACLICMHVCLCVVGGLAQLTCISASCCAKGSMTAPERERERERERAREREREREKREREGLGTQAALAQVKAG